jgi:hypothetical protein
VDSSRYQPMDLKRTEIAVKYPTAESTFINIFLYFVNVQHEGRAPHEPL